MWLRDMETNLACPFWSGCDSYNFWPELFGLCWLNDTVKLEGASGDLAFYNSRTGNKHLPVGISMEQRERLEKI